MAGFTKEEVAAELARRARVQRDLESSRAERARHNLIKNADAECLHCHQPYNSLTGGSHGLCDLCLHAD